MGLPSIEIVFKSLAASAIKRGERGIVAMIIKDTVPTTNPIVMTSIDDIPETLSTENKAEIERAFIGYINPPMKVIAYVIAADATNYTEAQNYLETIKWDYICVPSIVTGEVTAFASWVKSCRDTKGLKVKAVLPHCIADHEGIINFDTDDIKVGTDTFTAAQYCSRIAGIIAGTPLYMSATYATLTEVSDVPHHTKTEFDTIIDAGKLVLMNDGEKVKIARAVNSLVTTTAEKGEDFKKIKIIDIMDLIYSDIKQTHADNYVGKVPNDYDHKCLEITAINAYLEGLEAVNFLDKGKNKVEIDIEEQKLYLKGKGIDTDTMKDQEIKEANTGAEVMLSGKVRPLDAMEDLKLKFYM